MLEKPLKAFLIVTLILIALGFISTAFNNSGSPAVSDEASQEKIVLEHKYFASANSYSGSIMTPTDCYTWESDIEIDNTDPERIKLILSTDDTDTDGCEQIPSRKDFTFVVPSSQEAQLVAVELNGRAVNFEILEN